MRKTIVRTVQTVRRICAAVSLRLQTGGRVADDADDADDGFGVRFVMDYPATQGPE
jgi:hypothetical protein